MSDCRSGTVKYLLNKSLIAWLDRPDAIASVRQDAMVRFFP
jgi:hypothetical protein